MSTLTTVLGMLPLVLFPGAGSELYRGLGSVVLGGLLTSTVFTLVLVPMLFTLTFETQQWLRERWLRANDAAPAAKPQWEGRLVAVGAAGQDVGQEIAQDNGQEIDAETSWITGHRPK